MNAFYYGINLGWIAGIFLALFIVGGILAASMCAIPQKYQSRLNAGNTFIWSSLAAVVGLAGILPILIMTVSMDDLEAGKHWQTECKLMEVNIRDGAFSEAVNKLDCAGVIINIPSEKYYRYISEWQLYKAKNK
ncbi:hypothetical protein [Raoultella ornithinolytica]|uniref:hypothetical protein n=1 Tax=Raoultella ornithinolytica TaxID=54291 RepID=UPI001D18B5AD|nr:hypothetical protein [Raoultella ornithinolytica]